MADFTFHKKSAPLTLAIIAAKTGCELLNASDADFIIDDVAPLLSAHENQLSFLDNKKYREQFSQTKAAACIIHPDLKDLAPAGIRLLLSKSPYKSYAQAASLLYPNEKPSANISTFARIHESAKIGDNCTIDDFAVIGPNAEIGAGCWVGSHAVIGEAVKIGRNCRIMSNATITYAHLGDNVWIYSGVRIGQDGFGFAIDRSGFTKVPQLGRVIIEGYTEIGANTTIDRGALGDTVIGMGSWLDNQIQIAHNVKLGRGCIIAAQVGISGSTELGDYVMIGGQAGIAGHLKIGSMVKIAAKSGVTRDIPTGEEWMGYPAMPMKQFLRHTSLLNRLIKNKKVSAHD